MRIIGPPSAPMQLVYAVIEETIGEPHEPFLTMTDELWTAAERYNLDPVGVIAQSAKETNWGRFTGNVKEWFHNTCGLKVRNLAGVKEIIGTANDDHPLLHAQFSNWDVGAEAHVQHIRAYTGWPVFELVLSPRYEIVTKLGYRLENWSEFGSGKWAPATNYGTSIEAIMLKLQGRTK